MNDKNPPTANIITICKGFGGPPNNERPVYFYLLAQSKNEWMGNRIDSPRVVLNECIGCQKERRVDVTIDQAVLNHGSVACEIEL